MSVDNDQLASWYKRCSEDDIAYAQELLHKYDSFLKVKSMELDEQQHTNCRQARNFLVRFTLKGKNNATGSQRKQKKAQQTDPTKGKLR